MAVTSLTPMLVIMILKASQKDCYQLYHSTTEICCNGTVHPRTDSSTQCCGSQPFVSSAGLMCCNGRLVPSPQGDGTYDCCGVDDSGNPVPYDRTRQHCCQGAILEKPLCGALWTFCGQALCEFSPGQCCGGVVKPSRGNEMCCGSKELDSDAEVCCLNIQGYDLMGFAARKTDAGQDGCCDGEPFNTSKEICCTGQLMPRPPEEAMQCCGYQLYNARTEICCGYKVYPAFENARCCWSAAQVYDYTFQACCHDMVVAITEPGSRDVACCAPITY